MKKRGIIHGSLNIALAWALLYGTAATSCSKSATPESLASSPSTANVLSDARLPEHAERLAKIAFEAGSKFPNVPHAKNKARVQVLVVETCATVGLFKSGMAMAERIEGWQQGIAMAHLSTALARTNGRVEALVPLARAEAIASTQNPTFFTQEWQRDRIKAGIAETLVYLGRDADAKSFESNLQPSEADRSLKSRAEKCATEQMEETEARIDAAMASGHFDRIRPAIDAYVALSRRVADQPTKVNAIEAKVRSVVATFPSSARFDAFAALASAAIERKDSQRAAKLIEDAGGAIPPQSLLTEERIPLLARIVILKHRNGDAAGAIEGIQTMRSMFAAKRDYIVDIYRASALRGIAEAAYQIGMRDVALEIWGKALEEGTTNVNSRPRADDLAATCCSMIRSGAIPSQSILDRADAILKGLSDPW